MTEPIDLAWTPEACSLPTAERPLRVAEFDELFTRALRAQERPAPTRLRWRLAADGEATARELADRETSCCSFFAFSFQPGTASGEVPGDDLVVDVEVPAAQVDVLDVLEQRAAALLGRSAEIVRPLKMRD